MRGLTCKEYGPVADMEMLDWDDPEPGNSDVVVDVVAAGINFPDILSIAGQYQDKSPTPFIPGNEASGIVAATGQSVTRFRVGDRVVLTTRGGAFAECCRAHEDSVMPLPDALDFDQGAAYAVTYGTSYHALKQSGNLQPEETLLVLGAAGGVGIAAVELGNAMGAKVIAAASNEAKLEFARSAGADDTINYSSQSLKDTAKEMTGGKGVDMVYDPVGGELAQQAFRALAWHGRHLVVGFANGDIPKFPANIALLKEASIIGVWWGTWAARQPALQIENMTELAEMAAGNRINPRVTEAFPIEEFVDAFRVISERRAMGKVVLRLR